MQAEALRSVHFLILLASRTKVCTFKNEDVLEPYEIVRDVVQMMVVGKRDQEEIFQVNKWQRMAFSRNRSTDTGICRVMQ